MKLKFLVQLALGMFLLFDSQPLSASKTRRGVSDVIMGCGCDKPPQGPQGPQGPAGPEGPQGPDGPTGPAGTSSSAGLQSLESLTTQNITDILDGTQSLLFQSPAGVTLENLTIDGAGDICLDTTNGPGVYVLEITVNLEVLSGGGDISELDLSYDVDLTGAVTSNLVSEARFPNFRWPQDSGSLYNPVPVTSTTMFTVPSPLITQTCLDITLNGFASGGFYSLDGRLPYTVRLTKIN